MKRSLCNLMGASISPATVSPNVETAASDKKIEVASAVDEEEQDLKVALLEGLVQNHLASGDHTRALEYHSQRMQLLTNDADRLKALYEEAEIHATMGNYEKAESSLNEGIQICPKSTQLLKGKANLYLLMERNNDARKIYEKLVKYAKDCPIEQTKLLYTLGRIAEKDGDRKLAVKYYLQELQITKSSFGKTHLELSRIYHELARLYTESCDYKKALGVLGKALKVEQYHLSQCKHQSQQRIEISQLVRESQKFMGKIYYNMGDIQKALGTIKGHQL